jgi:hypothetical protein
VPGGAVSRRLPARLYVARRRNQLITGYRMSGLALWHDKGNPACRHCTYTAGMTGGTRDGVL